MDICSADEGGYALTVWLLADDEGGVVERSKFSVAGTFRFTLCGLASRCSLAAYSVADSVRRNHLRYMHLAIGD
jgi:hypothetical protein